MSTRLCSARFLPAASFLLCTPALAQNPTALVLEGDSVTGVGNVTQINNLSINDAGDWLVEVDTDNADTDIDAAVIRNGALLYQEGDLVASPAGAGINTFDAMVLNDSGDAIYNHSLENSPGGTSDNAGVYFNSTLSILKGDVATAPGFGPGTIYTSFSDVQLKDNGLVLMRGFGDDPNVTGTTDYYAVLVQLDGAGAVQSETLIAEEGQIPPGQTLMINTIRTGPHAGATNSSGDVIWCADLDTGSPPMDAVAYMNNTLLAQEGAPSPVAGRNWGDIISPEVDINDAGDWTFKDKLDSSDTSTDDIIIKNGVKFRQEGDTIPAISPFAFAPSPGGSSFGNGPVDLTEAGDVLWFGHWDDPDTTKNDGLFLNDTLLVQKGITQVGGLPIVDLGDQSENYYVSGSGDYVIFEATLQGGIEGAFLLQLGLGHNYCIATANSTGFASSISASGSASLSANDLVLTADNLPSQPGIFIAGPGQAQLPFFNGFLCIDPQGLQRFSDTSAPMGGTITEAVDYATSAPGGLNVVAGSSYNYQRWNRDPAGGGGNANFSDAIEITHTP